MKKKILIFGLLGLGLVLVLSRFNDGAKLITLVKQAKPQYLILAMCFQSIFYVFYSLLYQKSFKVYGIDWKFKDVWAIVLSSMFVNLMLPMGTLAGTGLFMRKAKKENLSTFAVTAGLFTMMLFDFFVLLMFLTISMFLLVWRHDLEKYEIVGYVVFVGLNLGLIWLLILGKVNQRILKGVFKFFQVLFNKIGILLRQKPRLSHDWYSIKSEEFAEISSKLLVNKGQIKNLLLSSLLMHSTNMVTIFTLFLAFGHWVKMIPLLVGYSIGILFWIVTPIPQGVGVVESIMPLTFNSFGVNMEAATLVTLSFRALSLWLPALVGLVTFKRAVEIYSEDQHNDK